MNLTDKDLKQMDNEYLLGLSLEELQNLSKKLLDDLRVSRDRLNMNAENSSCPSGSLPPWSKKESGKQAGTPSHGRRVELEVTETKYHKPCECAACGREFNDGANFKSTGGHYVLDVERSGSGYYEQQP